MPDAPSIDPSANTQSVSNEVATVIQEIPPIDLPSASPAEPETFSIGKGSTALYIDKQGMWFGSMSFATAPFSVDMNGNTTISGFLKVGQAAADVNAGTTTINGGKITTGSITASQIAANTITAAQIAAGTITATQIAANTITASKIASGTITATQISASAGITASQLSVSTLSAITANLGTITAGSISGVTITGGTLQTATSGQRVVISGSNNQINFYNGDGSHSATVYGGSGVLTEFTIVADNAIAIGGSEIDLNGGNVIVAAHCLPAFDNSSDLGNGTFRWALVRGVTITPGDLAWEETRCHICNEEFQDDDKLTMVVKKMEEKDGELLTYTVPICKKCFLQDN